MNKVYNWEKSTGMFMVYNNSIVAFVGCYTFFYFPMLFDKVMTLVLVKQLVLLGKINAGAPDTPRTNSFQANVTCKMCDLSKLFFICKAVISNH